MVRAGADVIRIEKLSERIRTVYKDGVRVVGRPDTGPPSAAPTS
jgi:hypothetical protein